MSQDVCDIYFSGIDLGLLMLALSVTAQKTFSRVAFTFPCLVAQIYLEQYVK